MLLERLKAQGSRALIFTQMSKMLDILEVFLNLHNCTYLRLDGSTKPEQRQVSLLHNLNPEFGLTWKSCMLDILEVCLNLHACTYLRLDGSTKPEQRQVSLQH